jgi:dTDP-4-amino-4,6-dideoxygalactose transaminase
LWLILESLKRIRPGRDLVAVPAYTCFSVPAAIVRAGLRIYPIDVDPKTLDLDYEQIESVSGQELLCILTANLFGYVNDWARMEAIADAKGAFLVDDGAQALGAMRKGRRAGTAGHVGFFSLARGKPLPVGEGGIIVTRCDNIAQALADSAAKLARSSAVQGAALFLKVWASSALLDPKLYWIPNSLPFLKLGVTEYDPGFAITGLPGISQALVGQSLEKLESLNDGRRAKAGSISASLRVNSAFLAPVPPEDCTPTYVRLPLLAQNVKVRDSAVAALQRAGIGASRFYPSAICDIAGIGGRMAMVDFHRRGAEELSRRLLTLPTHALVEPRDVERMAEVLGGIRWPENS